MMLSKLYSNKPRLFGPIEFVQDLNVIMAEIRLPENRNRDTHNLGKTTLGRLLDFGLLAGRDANFFLFKHANLFSDFVFYLELELVGGSYVTVRRSVAKATKIAFKKHASPHQDFTTLPETEWDHIDVPFTRAKNLLDSFLDWRALKPWPYRKGLGYFLRAQQDYGDVFQLGKFANKHADWKPFLAHILGFDAKLVAGLYAKESELEAKELEVATTRGELGGEIDAPSKIDGLLLLKRQEVQKKEELLAAFDFRLEDEQETRQLIEEIDSQIAELNSRRYTAMQSRNKIVASINEDQILFDPDDARRLFDEAGVLFEGQIAKDFEKLMAFNRAITEERRGYLLEERDEVETEIKSLNTQLDTLGARRSEILSFLSSTDFFDKYKRTSNELVTLRADIQMLERQRKYVLHLQRLRAEVRALEEAKTHLQSEIEADVESQSANKDSLFSAIRLHFNEVVEEVIDSKALLSVPVNKNGHLEFRAELLDESGTATSADRGYSYKKLLCIAFDLALLRAHLDRRFPRFAFHDGVFESLDDRKKENLLSVLRRYASLGIQSIITIIDSDLPERSPDNPVFSPSEIVLLLHDEGEQGRLFRMKEW